MRASPQNLLARFAALASVVLVAVVIASVATGAEKHRFDAQVPSALYIYPGTEVRQAGQAIGEVVEVSAAKNGSNARIGIEVEDAAWPIAANSGLRLKSLSSISYHGRVVEVIPPARPDGWLADGAVLAGSSVNSPVEIDEILRSLDPGAQGDLGALLRNGGAALTGTPADVQKALRDAPGTLGQARAILDDLGEDSETLDTLVHEAARAVHAVNGPSPGLGALVDGTADTFEATARHATALGQTFERAPSALAATRKTLTSAEVTLREASTLTDRLAPGVPELRRALPPLTRALRTIRIVAPEGTSTLRTARRATTSLNPLLTTATQQLPRLTSIAKQAASQVACIRPYAPEVAGFASNWGSFISVGDNIDRVARVNLPVQPQPNLTPLTPAQYKALFPQMRYSFPRPPGESSGQPWYIPECGVGPETSDPSKDPEARP